MDNVYTAISQNKDNIDFSSYPLISEAIRGGIERFYLQGVAPGNFLTSVICGNIRAVLYGDDYNSTDNNFKQLIAFFYYEVPGLWWGSREAYNELLQFHVTKKEGEAKSQVIT